MDHCKKVHGPIMGHDPQYMKYAPQPVKKSTTLLCNTLKILWAIHICLLKRDVTALFHKNLVLSTYFKKNIAEYLS